MKGRQVWPLPHHHHAQLITQEPSNLPPGEHSWDLYSVSNPCECLLCGRPCSRAHNSRQEKFAALMELIVLFYMSKNFILNKKFLNDTILFICLPSPLKGVNGEDLIYKMGLL